MNTTNIHAKLVEIITSAQSVGADVYAVVQREAPELAREIVLARMVQSSVEMFAACIAAVTSVLVVRWAIGIAKKDDESEGVQVIAVVSGLVAAGVIAISIPNSVSKSIMLLKCIITPRIVFIEEVGRLLK